MTVYVVTGLDLGWDCVVAVYANVDYDELVAEYPEDQYIITERDIETSIS